MAGALLLLLTAAVAWATSTGKHSIHPAVRHARASAANASVLLGDPAIEPGLDHSARGRARAFAFRAFAAGRAQSISVYLARHTTASDLLAGLYSSLRGMPYARLAVGSRSHLERGAWNTVRIASAAVGAGRTYWVVILAKSGSVYFRDRVDGPCTSSTSFVRTLRVLPRLWRGDSKRGHCPISAHVDGSRSRGGSAGSGGGSSGPGSPGTSGAPLPPQVTLQQIDGGPTYFSQFSNASGWDSPSFYPIAVWDQSLGYNGSSGTYSQAEVDAYKNEGVNGVINLAGGYNKALIDALRAAKMWALTQPIAPGYAGSAISGYLLFDEPEANNHCGEVPSAAVLGETVPCSPTSLGGVPASVIAQITADLHGAHGAGDPTRFVYGQYTKPVARNEGLSTAQASQYVDAVDVVSFDDYIINDGYENDHSLWEQYDLVRNVRAEGGYSHPVMPFIEAGEPFTSTQWSGVTATPAMSVAEAWNAIIGGARGIQWFDHDFGGSAGGYAESGYDLIDTNSVFASLQSAVKAFDDEVTALAPVLNSAFANGYVTFTGGSMNVMAKYRASSSQFYVFAAPRSDSLQNIRFRLAGGYTGPVTVYGENRSVPATNGQFTDAFAGQTAVHIYVIPNR